VLLDTGSSTANPNAIASNQPGLGVSLASSLQLLNPSIIRTFNFYVISFEEISGPQIRGNYISLHE
jgi:hypothetical protein